MNKPHSCVLHVSSSKVEDAAPITFGHYLIVRGSNHEIMGTFVAKGEVEQTLLNSLLSEEKDDVVVTKECTVEASILRRNMISDDKFPISALYSFNEEEDSPGMVGPPIWWDDVTISFVSKTGDNVSINVHSKDKCYENWHFRREHSFMLPKVSSETASAASSDDAEP